MLRINLIDCQHESFRFEQAVDVIEGINLAEATDSAASVVFRPSSIELALQCAASGKHILVVDSTSPIEQIDKLTDACSGANVKLMFARSHRRRIYQQAIADGLEAKLVGEPGLLRIHHWQPRGAGDTTIERLTDEVDVACSLFHACPEILYAFQVGDGIQAHLGFPAGGMALIGCINELPQGAEPYYAITLVGSQGAAYADDHHNTNLLLGAATTGLTVRGDVNPYESILTEFVDAVNRDLSTDSTIQEARRATNVAAAVMEAAPSRATLKLVGERYAPQ